MSSAQDPFVKEEIQDSVQNVKSSVLAAKVSSGAGHASEVPRELMRMPNSTEANRYDQYGGRDDEDFVQSESERQMLLIKQQDEEVDELSKSVQRITTHDKFGGQERVKDEVDTEMDSTKNQELQRRKMFDLMVHASACRASHCQYPDCRKVTGILRHGVQCEVRASGGCDLCKRMWYLLQFHSRACKESECHVPRCWDLKEHQRRLEQQGH